MIVLSFFVIFLRGATEAARKLDTRLGQGSNLTELFSSEITELRMR